MQKPDTNHRTDQLQRHLILLIFFLAIGTCPWLEAQAQSLSIRWFRFDPIAIRRDRTEPLVFKALIDGNPTIVQLALATGTTVPLSSEAAGVWSVTLTAAEVLFGYQSNNANHNFVGFLDVFQGATRVLRTNNFIGVLDENVPDVTSDIQNVGNTFRVSRHVANLWLPGRTPGVPSSVEIQAITQQFYQVYRDDYDFLNLVFALPSSNANRFHFQVKNDVDGIGVSRFNNTAAYGSNGRLQGINVFPIDTLFDMAEVGALHELAHQWINFSTLPSLQSGVPHWPISSLARGIMGFSIPPTGQGGEFPFNLIPLPNGDYQLQQTTPLREFTDLDLYLMGLLPADQVGTHIVFQNQNQTQNLCNGCILAGPVTTVTIADVIGAQGPRHPDAATSQKTFRVATIIVTKDRFLNNDELALFEYFAVRGESIVSLPFSAGFETGTTKPFYLATRGLSSLNTQLTLPPQPAPRTLHVSLANISTRGRVLTGDNAMIGGFIIEGSADKRVLIRSRGPSMSGAPFNLAGTLANPLLQLFSGQTVIAQNDNWQDTPSCAGFICEGAAAITATGLDPCTPNPGHGGPPPNCLMESAILISLPPGAYTGIVTGADGGTGIGLVEVFEADASELSELSNISTRDFVQNGDNVMIGGVIIEGTVPATVLIRARGPSMGGAPFNVPGTLANPLLQLFSGQMVIAQNDNWQDAPSCSGFVCEGAAAITAIGLDPCEPNPGQTASPPGCAQESAILITLPPGAYTAMVSGADGGTGVGLVEVFDVN